MGHKTFKIIIFSLLFIFFLTGLSPAGISSCAQDCPECQKVVVDACCQDPTAQKSAHPSPGVPAENQCQHGAFCMVTTSEAAPLLPSIPLRAQVLAKSSHIFSSFAVVQNYKYVMTAQMTAPPIPTTPLHITHCAFLI